MTHEWNEPDPSGYDEMCHQLQNIYQLLTWMMHEELGVGMDGESRATSNQPQPHIQNMENRGVHWFARFFYRTSYVIIPLVRSYLLFINYLKVISAIGTDSDI